MATLLSLIFFVPVLWILVFPFRIMWWGKRYIVPGILLLVVEVYAGARLLEWFQPTGVN